MNRTAAALAGALILSSPAAAQPAPAPATATVVQPVAAAPLVVGQPAARTLRAGTQVALKMSEALTTEGKKLRVGQRFQLEVAEPVVIEGQTVIPAGSPVTGEVTDVRNKGMWGKSGGINARVLFVRANGRQIRMTGQIDDKGVTGTAGVVGALVVIPVAGYFVTGTSARIPVGAPVTGFIDEDVPVAVAAAAEPAAMVVAPAQPN